MTAVGARARAATRKQNRPMKAPKPSCCLPWKISAWLGPRLITLPDVDRSIPVITAQLDDGYFTVRTGSPPDAEQFSR